MRYLVIMSVFFIGCSDSYTVELTYGARPDGASFRCLKRTRAFHWNEILAFCSTSKECEEICNKARLEARDE